MLQAWNYFFKTLLVCDIEHQLNDMELCIEEQLCELLEP